MADDLADIRVIDDAEPASIELASYSAAVLRVPRTDRAGSSSSSSTTKISNRVGAAGGTPIVKANMVSTGGAVAAEAGLSKADGEAAVGEGLGGEGLHGGPEADPVGAGGETEGTATVAAITRLRTGVGTAGVRITRAEEGTVTTRAQTLSPSPAARRAANTAGKNRRNLNSSKAQRRHPSSRRLQ